MLSALVAGFGDRVEGRRLGPLPGLTGFSLALIVIQLALLAALALTVTWLAVKDRAMARRGHAGPPGRPFTPFLGGGLAVVFAALAFCLGWLLTAVLDAGVARLLGTPMPGGFRLDSASPRVFAVPWPVFAAGAGAFGLVAGALLAAILIAVVYLRLVRRIAAGQTSGISIADAYAGRGGADLSRGGRRKIAGVWAIGQLADNLAGAVLLLVGWWAAAIVAGEIVIYRLAGTTARPYLLTGAGWLHGAVSLVALAGTLAAVAFVIVLRSAYTKASDRRVIGALWDVATFWPRAVHPLAPPCYAERAVPEVVDRIRLVTGCADLGPHDPVRILRRAEQPDLPSSPGLTVPAGPVLLTGYSQGSIIAVAVVAQLPREARDKIALLTLACPARRLYGRSFPAYFGPQQLARLSGMLACPGQAGTVPAGGGRQHGYRWRNVVRRSDYIGSWIFGDPLDHLNDPGYDRERWLDEQIDQPCWDPAVLVPDEDLTPPPVHRHSDWWPDPRSGEVGELLVTRLTPASPGPQAPPRPAEAERVPAQRTPGSEDPASPAAGPQASRPDGFRSWRQSQVPAATRAGERRPWWRRPR